MLPPDDEPEPKRWRGSIDKVPRRHGATVALATLAIGLGLGVAVGVSGLAKTGRSVRTAVAVVKSLFPQPPVDWRDKPSIAPPPPIAPSPPVAPVPLPPPARPADLQRLPVSSRLGPTLVAPAPAALPPPASAPPLATPPGRSAQGALSAAKHDELAERNQEGQPAPKAQKPPKRGGKHKAHRPRKSGENVVWSPEEMAVVPVPEADPAPADPVPATDETHDTPASSNPAQEGRSPRTVPSDPLGPPPETPPPNPGAPPTERQVAPKSDDEAE